MFKVVDVLNVTIFFHFKKFCVLVQCIGQCFKNSAQKITKENHYGHTRISEYCFHTKLLLVGLDCVYWCKIYLNLLRAIKKSF